MNKLLQIWPACLFLLIGIFFLSPYPLNPDGAELVHISQYGGVPHPSGYPVQAWLSQLFVWVSPFQAATTLSFLSLICGVISITFSIKIMEEIGFKKNEQCLGILFTFLLAPVWFVFLQPEKYGLVVLWIFSYLYFEVKKSKYTDRIEILSRGILWGLGLSIHPGNIFYFLVFFFIEFEGFRHLRKIKASCNLLLLTSLTAILTLTVLLLTLPLLVRTHTVFPNWGNLDSLLEIYRHYLKLDLDHQFNLLTYDGTQSGKGIIWKILVNSNPILSYVFILFSILSLFILFRKKVILDQKSCDFLNSLGIISVIYAFILAGFSASNRGMWSYFERFIIFLSVPLGLCIPIGCRYFIKYSKGEKTLFIRIIFLIIFVLAVVEAYPKINTNKASFLNTYAKFFSKELSKDAFFVGNDDFTMFFGIPTTVNGERRFPINLHHDWYIKILQNKIETRLKKYNLQKGMDTPLVKELLDDGYTVFSNNKNTLELAGHNVEQRGILYVAGNNIKQGLTKNTLEGGRNICRVILESRDSVVSSQRYYEFEMKEEFKRSLFPVLAYSQKINNPHQVEIIKDLIDQVHFSYNSNSWKPSCEKFLNLK